MNASQSSAPPLVHAAGGPADPLASRLAWLVHPLTPQEFVERYWSAHPVHLSGWPQRFEGLFDLATLRAAVTRQHEVGLSIRVSSDHRGDDGGVGRHVPIEASQIAEHLRRGASVCVDPVERAVPALRRLATDLRRELRHAGAVSVKCYLSPDGYGFNTHFDAHVVTTLQIEGTKRWRVSRRPGVDHPVDNAFLDAAGGIHYMHRMPSALRPSERARFDPTDTAEVVLRPGDVLCLPPGTWHEAKAEGSSLALNVAFGVADVLGLVGTAALARLNDEASWRAGLPVVPGSGTDEVPAEVSSRLRAHLARLAAVLIAPGFAEEVGHAWLRAVECDPVAAWSESPGSTVTTSTSRRVQCVLTVSDADRAAAWYQRVLGFAPVARIPEYGWVELATGVPGVTVGLTEAAATAGRPAPRLSLEVADLASLRCALTGAGAQVDDIEHVVAGVARFLGAQDIDGNRLVFFEPIAHHHVSMREARDDADP